MNETTALFHHAFPVSDIAATRHFYGEVLGCPTGRRIDERAVDFDFFGHHIIAHLVEGPDAERHRGAADGANVAVRHFGVALDWDRWEDVVGRLRRAAVPFVVEPEIRHAGEPREEALLVVSDPSGNGVEFKAFRARRFLLGG